MASASTALPSLVRPTANRAVHLRITPRPSSIGESREIMRLISQFGEIEHFRSLRYDAVPVPNAVIAIFRDEEGARNCLRKSPIRFRMGRVKQQQQQASNGGAQGMVQEQSGMVEPGAGSGVANPFGMQQQTRSLSTTPTLSAPARIPTPPPAQNLDIPGFPSLSSTSSTFSSEQQMFQITSNPARLRFRDQLNTSHFHGAFKLDTKSAAQQDLVKKVPVKGMSDLNWRAEEKPWKVTEMEREMDGSYRGSGRRRPLMEIYEEAVGNGEKGEGKGRKVAG